jgi:nucleoredoxin
MILDIIFTCCPLVFSTAACRGFTPELATWYEKHCLPGKDLHGKAEIIFVSADRSQDQFKEYFAEMPWKALPFDNKKVAGALNSAFEVEGIPTLVFVDAKTGEVVTKDGRERISNSPEGFPWPPRPVETLDDAMNFINDTAVCVVFAENAEDDAIVVAASEALEKVANEYFKDGKPDAKIRFALSTSANEDAALSIRNFLGGVHRTDRAGADAIRVTIIDVPNRTKALFKDGKLGPVDAGELAAFVKSYLEGSAKTVGIKA